MFGKVWSGEHRWYKTGEQSTTITSVRSSPSIVVRELQVKPPNHNGCKCLLHLDLKIKLTQVLLLALLHIAFIYLHIAYGPSLI